jgi:hypothetical protein
LIFNRERIRKVQSTTNTKLLGLKQFFITPYFPIAYISSLTLGFIVLYGGIKILNGDTLPLLDLFSTPCSSNVVQPFAQIADKFNEMQLGMIAANRVLIF